MKNEKLINLLAEDEEYDVKSLELAYYISSLEFVEKAVCLPDFHWKINMESPSSFGVATVGCIVPHFSSTSMNCGMGLINTGLKISDFGPKAVAQFYNFFRDSQKEQKQYDINRDELLQILKAGASVVLEKNMLPHKMVESIEPTGKCLQEQRVSLDQISDFFNTSDLNDPNYIGLKGLGMAFGGNHFLEIQYVAEIIDAEECSKRNITLNDMVIMYHTGGGIIPGFIGGYYARRMKGYIFDYRLLYNKFRFHFHTYNDILQAYKKWCYYFSTRKYVAIPAGSVLGKKHELLNQVAMNYGYAYRMVTVARCRDSLLKLAGGDLDSFHLVCDVAHNTIQKEQLFGNFYWIHRHNACRTESGRIGVLPGMNCTSSYIISGGDETEKALNTIPHGAGVAVNKYHTGLEQKIDRYTLRFNNLSHEPVKIQHIADDGVNSVVGHLSKIRLIRPLARLTPVAVLKDFRPKLL